MYKKCMLQIYKCIPVPSSSACVSDCFHRQKGLLSSLGLAEGCHFVTWNRKAQGMLGAGIAFVVVVTGDGAVQEGGGEMIEGLMQQWGGRVSRLMTVVVQQAAWALSEQQMDQH